MFNYSNRFKKAAIGIALMRRRSEPATPDTPAPVVAPPPVAPAAVSGGSEPVSRPEPDPGPEPMVDAPLEALPRLPKPLTGQRSSMSVRNLLRASSIVRGDAPSVGSLRPEERGR